ncbi:MAG: hypothetical protein ACXWWC_00340 [Chitinophagaceae bacterium]
MKKALAITSVQSQVAFQEKMLVDFVNRNLSSAVIITEESFSKDFTSIKWASTNIPANGRLDILFADKEQEKIERIILPVYSSFFITCTKESSGICKVAWCCSLS